MANNIFKNIDFRGRWETMSPNHKRGTTLVLGILGLALIIWAVTGTASKPVKKLSRDNIRTSILTDANTKALGIDALNAKVKSVSKENDVLNEKLQRMEDWRREQEKRKGNDPDVTNSVLEVKKDLARLKDKANSLGWDVDDLKQDIKNPKNFNGTGEIKPPDVVEDIELPNGTSPSSKYFRGQNATGLQVQNVQDSNSQVNPKIKEELKIRRIVGEQKEEETVSRKEFFIPAGSLISGVTLNGLDALTAKGAKSDPYPVVVRIQKEAILPNNVTADISECFVTMSGYGDLSSERVMARGEKLSCKTLDGNDIEVQFPSYAVGEDGKAGLRGRLVTRTGSLIAKTALAGFGSGIASAFGKTQVPVLQTGQVGGDKVFQNNLSQGTFESGMSGGAGAALERLAKYYMDMADQIYPVIEVDGGRQVDIFVTSGVKLTIRDAIKKR